MEERQPLLSTGSETSNNSPDPISGDSRERQESGTNDSDDLEQGDAHSHSRTATRTHTWREWMAEKLEAPSTHKAIIILITIDACCVLADLVYTFLSPERDCSNPGLNLRLYPASKPTVPGFPSSPSSLNLNTNHNTNNLVIDDGADKPIWLTTLSHISLTITTLFLLEIPLALWCFGLSFYNPFPSFSDPFVFLRLRLCRGSRKGKDVTVISTGDTGSSTGRNGDEGDVDVHSGRGEEGGRDGRDLEEREDTEESERKEGKDGYPYAALHLFDALIVLTTFILEVILRGREAELAGLLILFRLWRLVKLVGGLAVGAGELQEELSAKLEHTERLLHEEHARVRHLQYENAQLRSRLEGQDVYDGLKDTLVNTEVHEAV